MASYLGGTTLLKVNPQTKKVTVLRNAKVGEESYWYWDKAEIEVLRNFFLLRDNQENLGVPVEEQLESETNPYFGVRGTRTLQDIYEICNFALMKSVSVEEAL